MYGNTWLRNAVQEASDGVKRDRASTFSRDAIGGRIRTHTSEWRSTGTEETLTTMVARCESDKHTTMSEAATGGGGDAGAGHRGKGQMVSLLAPGHRVPFRGALNRHQLPQRSIGHLHSITVSYTHLTLPTNREV